MSNNDHVAAQGSIEDGLKRLSPDTHSIVIDGGNHGQFGDYSPQSGDGTATINAAEQWQQTVTAVMQLAIALRNDAIN
ncbi:MAG TPA: alpha/beta hydrolase [Anaerolineae bacterium]|nr:alpha/beta hydrolase [Anaerolineae bacterium]